MLPSTNCSVAVIDPTTLAGGVPPHEHPEGIAAAGVAWCERKTPKRCKIQETMLKTSPEVPENEWGLKHGVNRE